MSPFLVGDKLGESAPSNFCARLPNSIVLYYSRMHSCYIVGIEDLCSKRDEVQRQILEEEEEKRKIQNDIRILTERLAQVNESLAQKIATRSDYDQTIAETEAAYKKVQFEA